MKYALGIDIGGRNIKALAVTPAGRVFAEITVPTVDTGNRNWIANVKVAGEQIRQSFHAAPAWIGVAAPGLPAKDRRSTGDMPGRLAGLEGLNWRKTLRVRHAVPVLNDAHAALLGEVWLGAARRAKNVLLLTLGTGVGGAALVEGRLLRGHLGRAGHFGHISLDPDGAQDIVRTPGSLEDAFGECTIKSRTRGRFASTRALVDASNRNDREARAIWLKSVQALAAGIVSLINAFDPEMIVIGGGITNAGASLFRPLNQCLGRFEWRLGGARVRIRPAELGDRAGAFGAAWNAMNLQHQP
jgi:glucokinase